MLKDIHINIFQSKEDTRVDPLETSWENIVTFFTSPHDIVEEKFDAPLFNLVKYKDLSLVPEYSENWIMDPHTYKSYVRRRQVNVLENDAFIIDYDDSISLDEAKERFKDYEYIYYTSHRHLHDGKTEKFRFIIPFTKPIPSSKEKDEYGNIINEGDWYRIADALKTLTGPCDPKSFETNTIYHKPSCPKSRIELSQSGHHQGIRLDWTQLQRTEFIKKESTFTGHDHKSKINIDYLEPDTIIQTKSGTIKLSDVTGKIEGVLCPNPAHHDTNGSEFARKVESNGNIFVYCKKCEKKFYMLRNDSPSNNETTYITEYVSKRAEKYAQEHRQRSFIDEVLEFPNNKIYEDPKDRDLVIQQLNDIKTTIDKDVGYTRGTKHPVTTDLHTRKYKSHIIYMTEGAGKSRLVLDMANDNQKIIFACKSWEQVESKYSEYLQYGIKCGFNVKIVRSKDAKARLRFNTKVIRGEQKHPYAPAKILDKESIEEFIKNNTDLSPEFIRLSWNFFTTDKLSFDKIPYQQEEGPNSLFEDGLTQPLSDNNTRIILTTFEQLRIHKLKNVRIPKDWIIWFDDPDIMDVVDIEPYDTDKWEELPDDEIDKKTKEINKKRYFKRNMYQSLGYSLKDYKCIYTTTEIITRKGIELMMKNRQEEFITHDKMYNISGGHITILGTEMVRKRYDGVIPLLSRRLTKKKYPTLLIADGLSTEINHSNNKGRNDLSKINLLVELSIPHPIQVRTICDALSLQHSSNKTEITRSIILDRLHQAIGRNSGYRDKGFQCVALVDKSVHANVIEQTRYKIDEDNSVIIDRVKPMSSKDTRTSDSVSPIVQDIEYFLNNPHEYISDNRLIKPDIKYVFKHIKEQDKKLSYSIRLIVALSELSGVEITKGFVKPINLSSVQEKYWNIIKWIVDTHITEDRTEYVNKQIRETILDLG